MMAVYQISHPTRTWNTGVDLGFFLGRKALLRNGHGQNTDSQSMDYPNELPKCTTLEWTTPKNNISNEY